MLYYRQSPEIHRHRWYRLLTEENFPFNMQTIQLMMFLNAFKDGCTIEYQDTVEQ
jgi:hypothetical protein